MSKFLQFAPAENAKIKKVAKVLIAAKRFKQMGARRAERRRLEEVTVIKNDWTLKNPGTVQGYEGDRQSVSDINGVQNFTENTKGGQPIQDIPFMTEGLAYVLNNNEINTVAQLVAKFIEGNDGYNEPIDICKRFNQWLDKLTHGTIAEEGNVKINEGYGNETPEKAKVAVTKIIAHYADDRGLIETNWPEGNVYKFFEP